MTYTTQSAIGIAFDNGTESTPSQVVGTRMVGIDSAEWLYITAGSAIAQYDAVTVTEAFLEFQQIKLSLTIIISFRLHQQPFHLVNMVGFSLQE